MKKKMHSLLSPFDKKNNQMRLNQTFSEDEVELLKDKLNKDVRDLQVDRYYADPNQHGQNICLVSFIPSTGATPDKDNIYGMMKVRGVYATEEEANERADFIIRNVDSYHEIFHCKVGRPFPITNDNEFASTVHKIDIRKKTTELISKDILNKKKEEKEEMMEIQDREKNLLEESKKAQEGGKMDEFDEYITMNVKRAQLLWTYKETKEKLKQMKNSYLSSIERIKELDEGYPNFKDEYKEKYMSARRDAGIPDEKSSFVEYLGLDIDTDWDSFEDNSSIVEEEETS
tara:strand:+ start:1158 stop:2018 length:861 start_codon:yes stop_codon:yes gene_type:complete